MSVEDMAEGTNPNAAMVGVARSVLILAGCILGLAVPLCLIAVATQQTGTGGPWGVAAAAAVCLLGGLTAEILGAATYRPGSPFVALGASIAFRTFPPLLICMLLALQGGGGRQHLAFIVYLLAFYFLTLALDTWSSLQRIARDSLAPRSRA